MQPFHNTLWFLGREWKVMGFFERQVVWAGDEFRGFYYTMQNNIDIIGYHHCFKDDLLDPCGMNHPAFPGRYHWWRRIFTVFPNIGPLGGQTQLVYSSTLPATNIPPENWGLMCWERGPHSLCSHHVVFATLVIMVFFVFLWKALYKFVVVFSVLVWLGGICEKCECSKRSTWGLKPTAGISFCFVSSLFPRFPAAFVTSRMEGLTA